MRKKGSQEPTKDAGATAIAVLRREAVRGVLNISAISFACNIGALAVPLYNMEVFNRVMTTHNMRTLAGLSAGLAVGLLFYVAIDHLRLAAMMALGDRFARLASPPLLHAAALAGTRSTDPMQAIRDLEMLRNFIGSPLLTAPFELAWAPVLLVVLLALGWGYAARGW